MKWGKKIAAGVLAAAAMLSMAACGGGDSGSSSSSGPVELTVWAWSDALTNTAKAFNESHKNIQVKVTNVGSGDKHYQALNNAISAGQGAPDVAAVEYYALPQYVIAGNLYDLSEFGAKDMEDTYNPGVWSSVALNDGVYAMPLDSGPMALFYNKDTFEKAGITEPPTTMDEYYEDAKKIRALGDDYYIAADSGESTEELMMWVAGGTPFKLDGENITINLTKDKGVKTFIDFWQKLVDEDLIDTSVKAFTDDWSRKLNDGTLASVIRGAWMASTIPDNAPDTKGQWRVAPTPVFDENNPQNALDGGSSLAVLSSTEHPKEAYEFVKWCSSSDEGIKLDITDVNGFPSDVKTMQSEDFLNQTSEFFGDQKYNEVLLQAAENVTTDWQFLPYDLYARTVYEDEFGPAAQGNTTFEKALQAWEKEMIDYGKQQGYTVNGEK